MFLTAGTLYAVLLAFLVIAVWETYGAAKENMAQEAASLVSMYRLTQGMDKSETDTMQRLIREYVEAVVQDEWVTQSESGKASKKARKAIGDVIRGYGQMPSKVRNAHPIINQEFLSITDQVIAMRNKRIMQAGESLPWVMWLAAILGGLITVGMTFLLFMEREWPHVLMSGLMSLIIGTLIFSILVLNRPFVGPMALGAEPFESTLHTLDAVDQGN